MESDLWAVGVDLGGTKVEVAQVDASGHMRQRLRRATDVKDGPVAVEAEIVAAVRELVENAGSPPAGVGVGVAGQIEPATSVVRSAPNLDWDDVPLQADLKLAERIDQGVRQRALAAASAPLQVLPAQLHNDAGVVGAAALAIRLVAKRGE